MFHLVQCPGQARCPTDTHMESHGHTYQCEKEWMDELVCLHAAARCPPKNTFPYQEFVVSIHCQLIKNLTIFVLYDLLMF